MEGTSREAGSGGAERVEKKKKKEKKKQLYFVLALMGLLWLSRLLLRTDLTTSSRDTYMYMYISRPPHFNADYLL